MSTNNSTLQPQTPHPIQPSPSENRSYSYFADIGSKMATPGSYSQTPPQPTQPTPPPQPTQPNN